MCSLQQTQLSPATRNIRRYVQQYSDAPSFCKNLGKLSGLSLQKNALSAHEKFFNGAEEILGVIFGITLRPYTVNAAQRVILRAEQASSVTPQSFLDTVRDVRLWRDKRGAMAPAEVYNSQSSDSVINYENRFIVHLINYLSSRLQGLLNLYSSQVGSHLGGGLIAKDDTPFVQAYSRLNLLIAQVERLKRTSFYRTVSRADCNFARVLSTNLFTHNPAYSKCYRYYIASAGEEEVPASQALAPYFFIRLVSALLAGGFRLERRSCKICLSFSNGAISTTGGMRFSADEFSVDIGFSTEFGGLTVGVTNASSQGLKSTSNLLVFDPSFNFSHTQKILPKLRSAPYTSVEVMSPWGLAQVEEALSPVLCGLPEDCLAQRYLNDKLRVIFGSKQIYGRYCAVCGSSGVHGENSFFCPACRSRYNFLKDGIWLSKIRTR